MFACLLVCACVSKREEGPLTLCKKDSCGLQEGFWCCASSLMHFLSSRAATLGNYDDDYYEDQTYGLEGHANSKTWLNQSAREGRLPSRWVHIVVVMHFSVYFCAQYTQQWMKATRLKPGSIPLLSYFKNMYFKKYYRYFKLVLLKHYKSKGIELGLLLLPAATTGENWIGGYYMQL